MTVFRHLAAILAADVVGYSRLMEQHAFTTLVRLLLALLVRQRAVDQGAALKGEADADRTLPDWRC